MKFRFGTTGKRMLSLLMAILLVLPLLPASAILAAATWSDWTYDATWSIAEDTNVLSAQGTDLGAPHRATCNTSLDTNCVDFDLRQDAAASGGGHMGLWFAAANGDSYYFMYSAGGGGYASVIKYPAGGGETYLNTTGAYPTVTVGQWVNFRLEWNGTAVKYYVGGTLLHTVNGDWATIFDGATVGINTYATPISFKVNSLDRQEDLWADWTVNAWTKNSDGTVSNAGTDLGAAHKLTCNTALDTNCVNVDLRQDAAASGGGHMGLWFAAANGDSYYFMYSAGGGGYASVIQYPAGGGEVYLNATGAYPSVPVGQWVNFRVVYTNLGVKFYIGGQLIHSLAGDYAALLNGSTFSINTYATPVTAKVNSLETMENIWDGWTYSGWLLNRDDSLSNTGTDLGAAYRAFCTTPEGTNTVEFALRQDGAANAGNAHMGIRFIAVNGDAYYFMYSAGGGYASVIKYPAGGGEVYLNTAGAYPTVTVGQWVNFRVEYDDTCAKFYVGGSLLHTVEGDFASLLAGATVGVNTYATPVSFKVKEISAKQNVWKGWTYPGYTENSDSSLSYDGSDLGAPHRVTHTAPIDTNCVDFALRIDGADKAGNGHVGIWFTAENGDGYYFMFSPGGGYASAIKYPSGGGEIYLVSAGTYPTVTKDAWVDFRVEYDDTSIRYYVGGNLQHTLAGDYAALLKNAVVSVNSYAIPLSVKCNSLEPIVIEKQEWSYDSAWTKNEDGSLTTAGTDLGAAHNIVHIGSVTTNCIDVDIRTDAAPTAANGHVGVWVQTANNDAYYFMCNPYYQYASVIKYPAGGGEEYLNTTGASVALPQGQYTNFKVLLADEYVAFFIGGTLMHMIYGDFAGVFTDAVPQVCDYAIPATVKINSIDSVVLGQPAGDFETDWGHNQYWTLQADGSLKYDGPELVSKITYNYPINTNCITFKVLINETVAASDANLGLYMTCANGQAYFFQLNTFNGYGGQAGWITRYPGNGYTEYISKQNPVTLLPGQWYTVKVILFGDVLALYVNDELISYHYGSFANTFKNSTC